MTNISINRDIKLVTTDKRRNQLVLSLTTIQQNIFQKLY